MCMYFTKGINQDGYILCRQCKENKDMHPIFIYLYNNTFQCDDIILLIQEYIKTDLCQTIAGGYKTSVAILQNNTIKLWGSNYYFEIDVLKNMSNDLNKINTFLQNKKNIINIISIDCGYFHYCALFDNNTVKCWGNTLNGRCDPPDSIQGKVISISCGSYHSTALLNDNTIKCWGYNNCGQCTPPDYIQGKVVSISCGTYHSCALLNDMSVVCWGDNNYGQCDVPEDFYGKTISIECGDYYSLAILDGNAFSQSKKDIGYDISNTVEYWGENINGLCNIPDSIQGKVVSIKCSDYNCCALLNNNTIKCWGDNKWGQCNVPDSIQGKVVSIECGNMHVIALLNDNSIKCWGNNSDGQCNPPDSIQGKIMGKN